MRTSVRFVILAALLTAGWGCQLDKVENPTPTGPSELGLSLSVLASPDTILRNGESQSEIQILARDANARPIAGIGVQLDIVIMSLFNNPLVRNEFGELSAYSVVTGADGRASVRYTAPEPFEDWQEDDLSTNSVQILASPVGTDAAAQLARVVSIRLVDPTPDLASVGPLRSPFALAQASWMSSARGPSMGVLSRELKVQ